MQESQEEDEQGPSQLSQDICGGHDHLSARQMWVLLLTAAGYTASFTHDVHQMCSVREGWTSERALGSLSTNVGEASEIRHIS